MDDLAAIQHRRPGGSRRVARARPDSRPDHICRPGAVLAAGRWQLLPALPPGTVALAPAADGTTDALAVHQATLTVWQLASPGGSWTTAQTISVPIQYGSSG